MQRVHDSFNSIGEMFIFTFCLGVSTERQTEFRNFLQGLFDCQEQFYVWYEGAENKSYAPGVAAFLALRAILESVVGMLSGFADREQTVRMLLQDIDEIVFAMQAETAAQPQTTSGRDVIGIIEKHYQARSESMKRGPAEKLFEIRPMTSLLDQLRQCV